MDPFAVVFAFGVLTALGAGVGGALWLAGNRITKRDAAFEKLAKSLGGTFTPTVFGMLQWRSPAVDASIDDVFCRLDVHRQGSGKNQRMFTQVHAEFVLGSGPAFHVYEEGMFSALTKAFGAQDVVLGVNEAFDDRFVVKCNNPEATRLTWTADLQEGALRFTKKARTSADGVFVKVESNGEVDDLATLRAMMKLAAGLASVGTRALDAYSSLEEVVLHRGSGNPAAQTPPHGTIETPRGELRLLPIMDVDGLPKICLRLRTEREVPGFIASVRDGASPDTPDGVLTDAARASLRGVGDCELVLDDAWLLLTWSEAPSPDELRAGIALLVELAGGTLTAGGFR